MTDSREIEGTSLNAYATVKAGLDDGLGLADLCALVGTSPERWPVVDHAWQAALLDDLERDGALAETLEQAMGRAQLGWHRLLPPLDQDPRAWLDFVRSPERARDPDGVLERAGMRVADLRRLESLWKDRLTADAELRRTVASILGDPEGPLPEVRPEPTILSPRNTP
jgi:hypothetical protein